MKTIGVIAFIIIVLVGGFFALNHFIYSEKQAGEPPAQSPKDATYVIEGEVVNLEDGYAERQIVPGSAERIVTRYFGNEVAADLNKDGRTDSVFLLTQERGGSGVFFYVVAAINTENGYEGSQALFLGDRIAPQTTEFRDGLVIVNYADRRTPGDSMTTEPSVGKSIWLLFDETSNQFGEVVQDFEGEADPNVMELDMKSWVWTRTVAGDGRTVSPNQPLAFTLDFFPEGEFSATTDCNRIGGRYVHAREGGGGNIFFSDMISTKMYCEGSQESEFATMLSEAKEFRFTSRGQLILTLAEGAEMYFR